MADNTFGQGVETSEFNDTGVQMRNVRFGQSQDYKDKDGNLPVVLICDLVNAAGNEKEDQILSLGKGFKVAEGGAAIVHSVSRLNKNTQAGFGKESKGQTFLGSVIEAGGEAVLDHFEKVGVGPRHAAFWEGLTVWYVEERVNFGKPDKDGKQATFPQPSAKKVFGWNVEIPEDDEGDEDAESGEGVEGEAGDDGRHADTVAPKPRSMGKAAGKAAAKVKPKMKAKSATDLGITPEIHEELLALARESGDFEEFIVAAYDTEAINDDKVQLAVDDEVGGIWSQR